MTPPGAGAVQRTCPHLLVGHGAALQRRQVAAEQGGAGSVLLAEDGAVNVVEAISR